MCVYVFLLSEGGEENQWEGGTIPGKFSLKFMYIFLSFITLQSKFHVGFSPPEITWPNLMKLYRKLYCMTLNKNTRRHRDWPTTIWPTACFALQKISEITRPSSTKLHGKLPKWPTSCFALQKISEITRPNLMKLYSKLHCMTLYKITTRYWDWPTITTTKWLTCWFAVKAS